MATKSILKNIDLKKKTDSYNLIKALENAKEEKGKKVKMSRPYAEIKGEKLRELLSDKE